METLNFNLTIRKIPVELTDSSGEIIKYTLTELDGKARGDYITFTADRTETYKDKKGETQGRLTDFAALQTELLSISLIDEKGKKAPYENINKWPSSVCSALYNKARDISGLDDEAKDNAKNDSKASEKSG